MISGGAAFTFALLAFLAGMAVGGLRVHGTGRTEKLESMDAAATRAYEQTWKDLTDPESRRSEAIVGHEANVAETNRWGRWQPKLLIVSDQCPVGQPQLLDSDGVRELCGVDPETIIDALVRAERRHVGIAVIR